MSEYNKHGLHLNEVWTFLIFCMCCIYNMFKYFAYLLQTYSLMHGNTKCLPYKTVTSKDSHSQSVMHANAIICHP